jgi:hypothetical protein
MSLNMFKVYLFSIILVFVAVTGNAACNFKTGEFIDELTDPSNVIEIEIKLVLLNIENDIHQVKEILNT